MTPDLITAATSGGAALIVALAGFLTARCRSNREAVKELRSMVFEMRGEVSVLSSQLTDARRYIHDLLWLLADNGITPPAPPESLKIPYPPGQDPK